MKLNDSLLYLVLSLFIIDNILMKICIFIILLYVVLKKIIIKQDAKSFLVNLICIFVVLSITILVNVNLDIINFIFFVCFNFCLEKYRKQLYLRNFISLYFILILVSGGMSLWVNF